MTTSPDGHVILIFVISEDAVNPLADHGNEAVSGEVRVTTIVERFGDLLGETDLFVELADGGIRPPSLDRASLETSTTTGFWCRKLKTNGKADCKLIDAPPAIV